MRCLILIMAVAGAIAAPQTGLPSFNIAGYSSRSNIPDMKVTFENGDSYSMLLEPYSDSPCNFIGELENNPSSVAVTGCLEKSGDKMAITLLTDLTSKSHMYELDFDGNVDILENPFKDQKEPSGIHHLKSRDMELHNDKMGDEEEDPVMDQFAAEVADEAVQWPNELHAVVKFGYENTLKAQLTSDDTTFTPWIDSVMAHVQSYYKHSTLPTKIIFKYDNTKTIFKNVNWPSTAHLNDASKAGFEDNDPSVDLYAWFGKDSSYYGTVGLAWVGGACNSYSQTSFNEWRKSAAETAMVVAHEMGHNFGMSHDFDDKHGGDNSACNGQGIMSYGDAPSKWSTCSVSDFTGYYNSEKWGETCLKDLSWTKPTAQCGSRNRYSNCEQMASEEWNGCMRQPDVMITMCPKTSCPRTNCSGGTSTGTSTSGGCSDACPGSSCGVTVPDICTNNGCSWGNCYGGCTGPNKSYFDTNCKKTCGLC